MARTSDVAPNTSFGFSEFFAPVLNSDGEVAFSATLDDEDGTQGIWSEGDGIGALRKVALIGDTAPDAGGATFSFIEDPDEYVHFNNLGDVAFQAELSDGRKGLFTDRERPTNELTKIVLDGDQAPGAAEGHHFQFGFGFHAMGGIHSGTAFYGLLTPGLAPENYPSEGVFSESFAVVLDTVAEFAKPAPGTVRPSIGGGPALFTQLFLPTINDSGYVAFAAETNAGTGFGALGAAGVWSNSPSGTLRPVALAGQTAPGTALEFSSVFGRLGPTFDASPVINNDGDIAFMATLVGVKAGIWVERDGNVAKVAVENEAAPGTENTFAKLTSDPLIDGAGRAAFVADLDDNRDGLWKESSPGTLDLVAVQGQDAPGTALQFLNILDFAVNTPGQVAFKAQLSDIASDGIFATDISGVLRKVVATGDILDLDGIQAQISQISFLGLIGALQGNGNGTTNGFNDLGQVAFLAEAMDLDTEEYFNSVLVMDIPTTTSLPGDYNEDHVVDAADYTVWRDHLGSGESLPNDDTAGVGPDDYDRWRLHFGGTAGSGASGDSHLAPGESPAANHAVPEANALVLSLVAVGVVYGIRRSLS